jgi:hypothetical protein
MIRQTDALYNAPGALEPELDAFPLPDDDSDLLERWPHLANVAPGQPGALGEQLAHARGAWPMTPVAETVEQTVRRVLAEQFRVFAAALSSGYTPACEDGGTRP